MTRFTSVLISLSLAVLACTFTVPTLPTTIPITITASHWHYWRHELVQHVSASVEIHVSGEKPREWTP
jgi:hypothetical protein